MFLDTHKQLTLFTSEGKLDQCDNALKAATQGSLSVGCVSENGVVLASLKESNNLVILSEYKKIYQISPNLGITYSGCQPDFRIQYNLSLKISEEYTDIYSTNIPIRLFVEQFSRQIQEYTIKKGYRPFGTLLLIVGDNKMYRVDPSGSYTSLQVGTIGREYTESGRLLERRKGMLDDNISTCVECIREYCGRSVKSEDIDIGVYRGQEFRVYSKEEVQEVFDSINKI
uniref:Proteasome subunit alpha type-2 n=1 Tax=Vairimorpha necatrix TaxID=6039 RepID=UPI002249A36D|nr:Chain A, Proteasome subunit alpha type-2 [Vairimorpha necatrix]8ADN_O Chain O, Proteasome subunit alpha type-2 [Vairimorpha necatrix]